jgi:hypothetical protein
MAKDQSNMRLYFEGNCDWDAPISFDHFVSLCDVLCHQGLDKGMVYNALDNHDRIAVQNLLAWLRAELKKLRNEEKKPGSAPARRRRALPRQHIADVAIVLLDHMLLMVSPDHMTAKSNTENLISLFEELLNVDRHRAAFANQAQYTLEFVQATMNDAAAALKGETIAVNKLARKIGVSPATIIAWRKSHNYKVRVRCLRAWAAKDNECAQRVQRATNDQHDAAHFFAPYKK